jgi:hypothetical protein
MKFISTFIAFLLLFMGAAHAQSTTIYVHYANGVDKPMINETTADAQVTVEVTVTKPNGLNEDFEVKSTIKNNKTTRRQLAADLAAKLKQKFILCDIDPSWVTHSGELVTVRNTPPGVGKNTGTDDNPIKSPPKARNSHGHVRVYSR